MKKANGLEEMKPEYDFTNAVRGKYAARYAQGTNVVLLDPDVCEFFPDSKAVNETLRVIARLAQTRQKPTPTKPRPRVAVHRGK